MVVPILDHHYQLVSTQPSDIVDHLPTFLRTVDELKASQVIELGVRYGVSTIAWLYALDGSGHLWSVDVAPPTPAPGSTLNLLAPLPDVTHWTFVQGNDTDPYVVAALPDEVDIVFIDTNHIYEETLEELRLYVPKVRPGGRVLLHDTALAATANAVTPQPPYPVRSAVAEFCRANDLRWTETLDCYGLGTIVIPG